MQPGSGGVPTRQRGFPKCPAVLGWVAAGQDGFLQFAEEPKILCNVYGGFSTGGDKNGEVMVKFSAKGKSRLCVSVRCFGRRGRQKLKGAK